MWCRCFPLRGGWLGVKNQLSIYLRTYVLIWFRPAETKETLNSFSPEYIRTSPPAMHNWDVRFCVTPQWILIFCSLSLFLHFLSTCTTKHDAIIAWSVHRHGICVWFSWTGLGFECWVMNAVLLRLNLKSYNDRANWMNVYNHYSWMSNFQILVT